MEMANYRQRNYISPLPRSCVCRSAPVLAPQQPKKENSQMEIKAGVNDPQAAMYAMD